MSQSPRSLSELLALHCEMGVNRSNLFAAAALVVSGMNVQDAIKLLRERRSPHVLMNQHFEDFLRDAFGRRTA